MGYKVKSHKLAMAIALSMNVSEVPREIYKESQNKGQDWKGRGKRKKVMK